MTRVIFENDRFIIAHKPAGILTVPDRAGTSSARRVLGLELQDERGLQIFPVHRLDFTVEGLVLFAKDAAAHQAANTWLEHKLVQKTYRAWTTPQSFVHIPEDVRNARVALTLLEGKRFEWRCKIQRGKRRAFESPRGQPSITRATYLGKHAQDFLQWDLEPVSGRAHQLRFELSRHGFPIVGDALYGSLMEFGTERIALKAYRLDFSALPESERLELPAHVEISPQFENGA